MFPRVGAAGATGRIAGADNSSKAVRSGLTWSSSGASASSVCGRVPWSIFRPLTLSGALQQGSLQADACAGLVALHILGCARRDVIAWHFRWTNPHIDEPATVSGAPAG